MHCGVYIKLRIFDPTKHMVWISFAEYLHFVLNDPTIAIQDYNAKSPPSASIPIDALKNQK